MPSRISQLGLLGAAMITIGVLPAGAQQQVIVTVTAVPNQVTPGTCTRIVTEVRDELNRPLMLADGTALGWGSFAYASANGTDFEWRPLPSGEAELCAKPGAGVVTTQVTASIPDSPYTGATTVAVAAPGAIVTPPAGGQVASAAAPPASPSAVPTQPYVAPPGATSGYASPSDMSPAGGAAASGAAGGAAAGAAYPAQGAGAAQGAAAGVAGAAASGAAGGAAAGAPYPAQGAGAAQGGAGTAAVPAAPPPQVAAPPVKSGGGFFKKLGSHIKQRAAEVKTQTSQNLTAAATQIVDTTFQTGTKLVASTTAQVTNTARLGIGGVGQKLMLAPQQGGGSADNLTVAIASGHAVLLEVRFTPGTSVLEPSGRQLVERLGNELRNAMAQMPAVRFEINAHMDSEAGAQVLSEERAAAVKAVLRNYADEKRITALGFGTSQPLAGIPTSRIEVVRCNDGKTRCLLEVSP